MIRLGPLRVFLGALLALASMAAGAQDAVDAFVMGPEHAGLVRLVRGTVVGIHVDLERTCHVVLADRADTAWQGLGGEGRFFWCARQPLALGARVNGQGLQEGTRLARVGPRWRVLPLFVPAR